MTIILERQTRDVPDEYALRLISQGMAEPFIGEPEPEKDDLIRRGKAATPSPERGRHEDAPAKAKPEKESRRDVSANEPKDEG